MGTRGRRVAHPGSFAVARRRQVTEAAPPLQPFMGAGGLAVAVWTTTPWTLPANLAVAVSETIVYAVVEHPSLGSRWGEVLVEG